MKLIAFVVLILFATTSYSQDYYQILVGNSWKISSMKINNSTFQDSQSTCIYTMSIHFINSSLIEVRKPCADTVQKYFTIDSNKLIINNIDTVTITSITTNSFETTTNAREIGGNRRPIVTTIYEKE